MAGVHLETRATGILSTTAIMPGETSPYGTIVNPGVLATNHQHLSVAFILPLCISRLLTQLCFFGPIPGSPSELTLPSAL